MVDAAHSKSWIALACASDKTIAWRMNEDKAEERQLLPPLAGTVDDIETLWQKTDWSPAPVFSCGQASVSDALVPAQAKDLPVVRHKHVFGTWFQIAGLNQSKPKEHLGLAAVQVSGFLSIESRLGRGHLRH